MLVAVAISVALIRGDAKSARFPLRFCIPRRIYLLRFKIKQMCRLCHDPYQPPCFLSLFRVLHEVAACSSSPSRLLFSPTDGPLLAWLQDVAPFFFTPSGSRALGSFFPTRIARLRSYLLPAPTAQPQRPAVLPSQKSTPRSTFSHEYRHTSCFTLRVSSLGGSRIIAARLMCTTRTPGTRSVSSGQRHIRMHGQQRHFFRHTYLRRSQDTCLPE